MTDMLKPVYTPKTMFRRGIMKSTDMLKTVYPPKKTKTSRTDGKTDNVKTVYSPTNIVCGGYNYVLCWGGGV